MKPTENTVIELSTDLLRTHFRGRQDPPPSPIYRDDSIEFKRLYEESKTSAAVLIPILDLATGPELLLTRRADHLRSHAGQISFPGGRIEEPDESYEQAALREAQEEISLPGSQVDILGRLGDYYTITGFRVTPVIGLVQPPVDLQADPSEVAEIIQVPFNHLMNPEVFVLKEHQYGEMTRRYYSTFYGEHHIWGVTAGILMGLYEELLTLTGDS